MSDYIARRLIGKLVLMIAVASFVLLLMVVSGASAFAS